MRHLVAQIIMGTPALDAHDSLTTSIIKAVAFRVALAFLMASVYPALATAPTRTTDTTGRPTGVDICTGAPGSNRPVLVAAPPTEQPASQAPAAADQAAPAGGGLGKDTVTVGFGWG